PAAPRLIPGSVAIELSHLATLYHDDVIDESADRRGVPSANARWDNTVAILTGDYLFALASEMSADLGPDVCRLLARTITVLCDGQIREVDAAGSLEQDEDGYLEVIRRKTGSLIATSCRLAGVLSDAAPARAAPSGRRFGAPSASPRSSPTAPRAMPWCSSRGSSRSVAAPTPVRAMRSSPDGRSARKPLLGYGSLRRGPCTA